MREDGRLVLNLEDMWDDFASSVESLIAQLRESLKRTEIVLNRWHRSRTEVRQFGVNTTASASASVVVVPPPGA
jgi:hypothetical protein